MKNNTPRRLADRRPQRCRLPPARPTTPLSSTELLCREIDLIRLTQPSLTAPQTEE